MDANKNLTLSVFDIGRLLDHPWLVSGPLHEDEPPAENPAQPPELCDGERLAEVSDRMMLLVLQRRGSMRLASIDGRTFNLSFYADSKRWDVVTQVGPDLSAEFARRLADPKYWSWGTL